MKENVELALGANVINGKITYKGVADAFGMELTPIDDLQRKTGGWPVVLDHPSLLQKSLGVIPAASPYAST